MLFGEKGAPAFVLVMPYSDPEKNATVFDTITLGEQTEYVRMMLEKNLGRRLDMMHDRGSDAWLDHMPMLALVGAFYCLEMATRGLAEKKDVDWFIDVFHEVEKKDEPCGIPDWLNDTYIEQSQMLLHKVAPDFYTSERFLEVEKMEM